jgi:cob(I)alamin adenosyltransferase
MKIPDLLESDVEVLEKWMDEMDAELPEMRFFVLPGGNHAVSFCHVARCVCRRAERLIVELDENDFVAPLVLSYMNRLSDYLFVLSRKIALDLKTEEQPWHPRV